jgi:hypothetical protein
MHRGRTPIQTHLASHDTWLRWRTKGAAHIAFKRGFFDATLKLPNGKKVSISRAKLQEAEAVQLIVASPTIDHHKKKKPKVKRDKETSVREILKRCEDFANETPQLEFYCSKIFGGLHPPHTQVPSGNCWTRHCICLEIFEASFPPRYQ